VLIFGRIYKISKINLYLSQLIVFAIVFMKRIAASLIFIFLSWDEAHAQQVTYSSDTNKVYVKPAFDFPVAKPKKPKPIMNELSFGFRLNTDGWTVCADLGKVKTSETKKADMFHNLVIWQLEVGEKRHPKEQKIESNTTNRFGGSKSYKYAKINNMYTVKIGGGYSKMLAGKPDPGCSSIHWVTVGGFALALVKPYYIYTVSDQDAIKYSKATEESFLTQSLISGRAGFSKGIDEMKYLPGGHLKTGIHFDFATTNRQLIGLETGVNAEYYSEAVQLMATQPARAAFVNLYVSVLFGGRW
jgi:hypothetical protein